jgi:multidrug efflux pump subunit AcrB
MMRETEGELGELLPDAVIAGQSFILGPGEPGKIRVRIAGPDPEVLRELAGKAERILTDHPNAKSVRNDWRTKIKVLRPQLADAQARVLGIERPHVAQALDAAVEGHAVGIYREKDELLPVIARSPEKERINLNDLGAVRVWSTAAQQMIPMGQVVTGFATVFEDPYIWRRHRSKTVTVFADPKTGLASELLKDVKVEIEKALNVDLARVTGENPSEHTFLTIPIKEENPLPLRGMQGYSMAWGGQAEDSAKAQANLSKNFPPSSD